MLKKISPVEPTELHKELQKLGLSQDEQFLADRAGSHNLIHALTRQKERWSWQQLKKLPPLYLNDLHAQCSKLKGVTFKLDASDLEGRGLPGSCSSL
jgi:hypothetical protein